MCAQVPRKLTLRSSGAEAAPGTPCSLRDGKCLTERKPTHMEEYGNTLILSVDDEPTNHLVIEEALESAGYKVGHCCCSPLHRVQFCKDLDWGQALQSADHVVDAAGVSMA